MHTRKHTPQFGVYVRSLGLNVKKKTPTTSRQTIFSVSFKAFKLHLAWNAICNMEPIARITVVAKIILRTPGISKNIDPFASKT